MSRFANPHGGSALRMTFASAATSLSYKATMPSSPALRVRRNKKLNKNPHTNPDSETSFPSLDDHLVEPETSRDEIVEGLKVIAMPAKAPHADQHCELDFLVRGHIKPDYQSSSDMLTRVSEDNDFATDTAVRKKRHQSKHGRALSGRIGL